MENKNYNGGISLSGLATIAFVVLKLCGVIDWSWWWVLAPTWIPVVLVLICACVLIGIERWEKMM